jgi:platelet-activating factor acetylhydrolase
MIPANHNAPLLPKGSSGQWPVLVFSHGLGGSCNAYSHLLGSLASCGIVCIAPEHRDQSAPVSIIRQADGSKKNVRYKKLSHDPNPEVLSGRNAQLCIRLWELELVYSALSRLNEGRELKNLGDKGAPRLTEKLDLRPSKVTWGGHSFGAATMVQFVKSAFWHQTVPKANGESRNRSPFEPLYTPALNSALKDQITANSPVVLLDLWTMPLRSDTTQWLWEKPLPCYASDSTKSNVLAIMSEEFYKWSTLLDRVKAVLSKNPAQQERSRMASRKSPSGPRLFYAPKTAHLSQSDFGILFPWATKKWMHAEEPERTLLLNTRAILQLLRENETSVEGMKLDEVTYPDEPTLNDSAILAEKGNIQGWVPLSID